MQAAKLAPMHVVNWKDAQGADTALAACRKWLKAQKDTPVEKRDALLKKYLGSQADMEEGCALFHVHNSLVLSKELLYLSTAPKGEMEGVLAFLVPSSQCTAALNGIHHDAGHQGQQRTLALAQERFWWPMMVEDCKALVRGCPRCHPIAFRSHSLTPAEKNYHSLKLEFLTLKWSMTEHFKEYLVYAPFVVRTDNNPLTYVLTTPNLDTMGHKWVGTLASFEFSLEYQKGTNNGAADTLSQVPVNHDRATVQSLLEGAVIGTADQSEAEVNEALLCEHVCLVDEVRVQAASWLPCML